jgi:hypothetical protein
MITQNNSREVCRFYKQGQVCKFGDNCRFLHDDKPPPKKKPIKAKNTENFKPCHVPADILLLVENGSNQPHTKLSFQTQDVIVVTDLFGKDDDMTIYNNLLKEMNETGISEDQLWKLWHGDTHLIADDHLNYKDKVPTFMMVINKLRDYFNMDIKATRFNLFRGDSADWKPFHHDASAVNPEKAKIQNFTVGVSFGATREIAFEDAKNPERYRKVISVALPNSSTYAFTRDININWKHGIPQLPPNKQKNMGRISIIAWGYLSQDEADAKSAV